MASRRESSGADLKVGVSDVGVGPTQMAKLRSLCVFCGSSSGVRAEYGDAARALGALLAQRGIRLVYGGGNVGLMGVVADACLAHGGHVVGVIPESLERREVAHRGLTELRVVDSMHARKAMMADLADGFVALPGGIGTFEELFEIWTWGQLGIHQKPCGILNVAGYYDHLIGLADHAVREGFLRAAHRASLLVDTDVERLLEALEGWSAPGGSKWVDRAER